MTKELKQFQQKAVDGVLAFSKMIFAGNDIKTIVLQSPTGSGKTFMMSQIINKLATDSDFSTEDLCFLWVSIGKGALPEQTYKSLKKAFNGYPDCYLLENEFIGGRDKIERNEVVILNWEKLRNKDKTTGEWTNTLMKDKETFNFIDVINNTKENGRKIILIIDESHASAQTERAKELRDEVVCPDLTIEMSATPVLTDMAFPYKVNPMDVINEGLIKKEIIINLDIDKISDDEIDSEKLVLEASYHKQKEIKALYEAEGIDINPLVLIQLPNSDEGEHKKESIEAFLQTKGVSLERGNLAIWLSDEKANTETPYLIPNTSKVDFLIFKQAIDTGWDCPRASILVRFRDTKSETFEIQTVGRILRMPEAKHYNNEALNKGYIYTNIKSIVVKKETYNPNIIKSLCSTRKDNEEFSLRSYYRNRVSYNDITSSYYPIFEEEFCKFLGLEKGKYEFFDENKTIVKTKLKIDNLVNDDEIILNKAIEAQIIDEISKIDNIDKTKVKLSEDDKSNYVREILKAELNGFAPKRSLPIMYSALLGCLTHYLGLNKESDNWVILAESIILNNEKTIKQLLNTAIEVYKPIKLAADKAKANSTENFDNNWTVPKTKNYNPNIYELVDSKLCLYSPCYLEINRSSPEQSFIEYIDKQQNNIVWWWKNGDEATKENFGIKKPDGYTFQPDFIVKYKNGKIGLYDTKDVGFQEDDNKIKAEALQAYIKEENEKGKNLCGGIIIVDNGHLKINDNDIYVSFKTKPDDWKFFE